MNAAILTTADLVPGQASDLVPGETLRDYRRRIDHQDGRRPRLRFRQVLAGSLPVSLLIAARGVAYYRANPYG